MSPGRQPIKVLFLCTHNSARSILAEALLNHLGAGRFAAFSAGSHPRPHQEPHPLALAALREAGIDVAGLRSKSWEEFSGPDAQTMDLIITVCDDAAGETCPLWPGHPALAHWGYADPSAGTAPDSVKLQAFRRTLFLLRRRLERLLALPADQLMAPLLAEAARHLSKE
jgi:arsenate reductase